MTERSCPVFSLTIVTVAPGMTAPVESFTVPEMRPVSACPHAITEKTNEARGSHTSNPLCVFMITPPKGNVRFTVFKKFPATGELNYSWGRNLTNRQLRCDYGNVNDL
jgi:hypothetical protein